MTKVSQSMNSSKNIFFKRCKIISWCNSENICSDFKSRLCRRKDRIPTPGLKPAPEPAPDPKIFDAPNTKRKVSPLKLCEKVLNKIKNEERDKNDKICKSYFYYQDPSSLAKELYKDIKIQNNRIVKHINESLID